MVNIITKKYIFPFFLFCSFIHILNLPIPFRYNIEAIVLFFITGIGGYLLLIHFFKKKIYYNNKDISLHYILICLFIVSISALLAYKNFNQPISYGLAAGRRAIYAFLGIIFYFALKHKILSLEDIENSLVKLFFSVFLIYFLINIFFPPQLYLNSINSDPTIGFATFSEERGINRYLFDLSLLIWGLIYSLHKTKKSLIYVIYIGAFIYYLLFFHRGRIVMVLTTSVIIYYFLYRTSLNVKINIFVISVILFSASLFLVGPEHFSEFKKIGFFIKQGIDALTGTEGSDVSANARVWGRRIAWQQIQKFSYIGAGAISNKWDVPIGTLFRHFYHSDLGLLGLWFRYSFLSILFYFYISYKSILLYRSVNIKDPFIGTCWIYILYVLASSIFTGQLFFTAYGQLAIMYAVIGYSITQKKKNRVI